MEAPYTHKAQITEINRALIVLMIDQSGSMAEPYTESETKAAAVAEFCNSFLAELIARCRQGTLYGDYFDVAVIGYSGGGVYSALPSTESKVIFSPTELAASIRRREENRQRIKNDNGRTITIYQQNKIWVEAAADGRTPTLKAFERLTEILYTWRSAQRSLTGYPPTIINITDGQATDCRPEQLRAAVAKIDQLGTADGCPLLINVHISAGGNPLLFPSSDINIDPKAALWYELSSVMPACFAADIASIRGEPFAGTNVAYRGVVYNAPVEALVQLLNIGSTTTSHIA